MKPEIRNENARMKSRILSTAVTSLFLGAAAVPARAELLTAEDFNYTNGYTVNDNALDGGTGFSGAWTTNNMPTNGTGTVNTTVLATGTGNSLFVNPTSGTTTAFRQLSGTLNTLRGSSDVLYLSYIANVSTLGTRFLGLQMNRGYTSPASAGTEALFIGKSSPLVITNNQNNDGTAAAVDGLKWLLAAQAGGRTSGSTRSVQGPTVVVDDSVMLLVKFDFALDSASFWVLDPDALPGSELAMGAPIGLLNGTSIDMDSTAIGGTSRIGAINAIRFGSGFTTTSPAHTTSAGSYDRFVLSTDFNSAVTSEPSGANDFAAWAASQSPPFTGGPNGDDNNNGVPNLIEYALADGQERGSFNGSTLSFTKRGAPWGGDVTYLIETSGDLGSSDPWETVTPEVNDPTTISFTLQNPGDNFARLKVSQN